MISSSLCFVTTISKFLVKQLQSIQPFVTLSEKETEINKRTFPDQLLLGWKVGIPIVNKVVHRDAETSGGGAEAE